MKKVFATLILLAVSVPQLAFAQLTRTRGLIEAIGDLVRLLTTVVAGIALLVFFWGLVKFIRSVSESGKTEGKTFMMWGIIALFVMVSVWGLVAFIQGEFGIARSNIPGGLPGSLPVQNGFPTQLPGQSVQLRPPSTLPADSPSGPFR